MKVCTLGRILKRRSGYGFTVVFKTPQEAQKYKDQIKYVIKVDRYRMVVKEGYHDQLL